MFEYNGIAIRPVEERDLSTLLRMRNDKSTWNNLSHIDLISETAQVKWFEKISSDPHSRYYMAHEYSVDTVAGCSTTIGLVRITQIDWINRNACVGCDIVFGFRGAGLGKKLMALVVKYCFDFLNMNMLYLMVADYNKVAQHVYETAGFKQTGSIPKFLFRDGQYHDYIIMNRLRTESVRDTAIRLGMEIPKDTTNDGVIDQITGKRLGPEE